MTAFGIGTNSSFGPYDCPRFSAHLTNGFSSDALFDFSGTITQVKVQIA